MGRKPQPIGIFGCRNGGGTPFWWLRSGGIKPRWGVWTVGGVLLLLLAGCATYERPQPSELLWPAPPETPRIKFEGVLRDEADLGNGSGNMFMELLLGPDRPPDSLEWPMGIAPSRDGKRVYIADQARQGVIVFNFETGRVSILGEGTQGMKAPFGIALDDKENVYVVDTNEKLIRVFTPDGKALRNITHTSLERPTGIAIDTSRGRIYVADSSTLDSDHHVISVFDMNGTLVNVIGKRGEGEGKFFFPTYLALDDRGNLFVADTQNARVQVFSPDGRHIKTVGRRGDALGMFNKPKGVALDTFGNLYVVDSGWGSVQIFNQERDLLLFFGGRGRMPGLMYSPTGIAIDKFNRIYVADPFERRVNIYRLINTKAEDSSPTLPFRPEKGGDQSERNKRIGLQKITRKQ
ncbi:MAG: SMP-30/gluconolactonase/LRE family protein [Candidatus Binatia bacterium]